jgi:hypothetical protein
MANLLGRAERSSPEAAQRRAVGAVGAGLDGEREDCELSGTPIAKIYREQHGCDFTSARTVSGLRSM